MIDSARRRRAPRALRKADTSREYPTRPIVGVGAVIIIQPAEAALVGWTETLAASGVVLVKRRFEPLAGEWSLPGGKVEAGETLEEATAREIVEETGLVVEVGPLVEVLDRIFRDDDGRVRFHYVAGRLFVPGARRPSWRRVGREPRHDRRSPGPGTFQSGDHNPDGY